MPSTRSRHNINNNNENLPVNKIKNIKEIKQTEKKNSKRNTRRELLEVTNNRMVQPEDLDNGNDELEAKENKSSTSASIVVDNDAKTVAEDADADKQADASPAKRQKFNEEDAAEEVKQEVKEEEANEDIKNKSNEISSNATAAGKNFNQYLHQVISNLYLNIAERLKLDFSPRCLDDLAHCHRHHYRSDSPEAPISTQQHSLRSALQQHRYISSINSTIDMCYRGEFPGKGIFTKVIELVLVSGPPWKLWLSRYFKTLFYRASILTAINCMSIPILNALTYFPYL